MRRGPAAGLREVLRWSVGGCRLASLLAQNLRGVRLVLRDIGNSLAPVEFDELLGNAPGLNRHFSAAVIAVFHREVRQGQEKRVLVSRDELTLGQQTLEIRQERELFVGRRWL